MEDRTVPQPGAELNPDYGLPEIWADYLSARGVTPAVAEARGYKVVVSGRIDKGLPDGDDPRRFAAYYDFPSTKRGMLIPLHSIVDGDHYQLRVDHDLVDPKSNYKFQFPKGRPTVLSTHPFTRDAINDPAQTLWVAEGVTRVDALAHYRTPAVGLGGCWNWRNKLGALSEWDEFPVKERNIVIAIDGDVTTNLKVYHACGRLSRLMEGRGAADVAVLILPDGQGLDDYLATHKFADADAMIADVVGNYGVRYSAIKRPSDKPIKTEHGEISAPDADGNSGNLYRAAWLAHHSKRHGTPMVVVKHHENRHDGEIGYVPYVIDSRGMLDSGEGMTALRIRAMEAYMLAGSRIQDRGKAGGAVKDALNMREVSSVAPMYANIGASAIVYPGAWVGIRFLEPTDLDMNLSVIGTPDGVWDFESGQILDPAEAAKYLVTASIPWSYRESAAHPVAIELFASLYGDLQDTTTEEFERWLHAAVPLVRRPMREILVKIAETKSAKTTERNLMRNAFHPLVTDGSREAIEVSGRFSAGGSAHNSYLENWGAPARRICVPEVVPEDSRKEVQPLNLQRLRDLSEDTTITFRIPGPYKKETHPFCAHVVLDGNVPSAGNDLLGISGDSDSARAVKERLRASVYRQIPEKDIKDELRDYGNPDNGDPDDVRDFNETIVSLMFDGIRQHFPLLMQRLPTDGPGQKIITDLANRGKQPWETEWLHNVLRPVNPIAASPEGEAHTRAVYDDYLEWHEGNADGCKPVSQRAITNAVLKHYLPGKKPGDLPQGKRADYYGKRATVLFLPGLTLDSRT